MNKERFGEIWIVFGMQFGSEGKGAITEYLSPAVSAGVRIGAANAGHTIYYHDERFIMRQLPSVWINPHAQLIIGINALLDVGLLFQEVAAVEKFLPVVHRLRIDYRAHVITEEQKRVERDSDLAVRISSTSARLGEGIGRAAADKVLRKESCVLARDVAELQPYLCDTTDVINTLLEDNHIVLVEGTQGFGLSLDHGYFPYVTSRDTTVAALAAGIGVGLHEFPVRAIGVVRTYPIRVAGQSGPFDPDSQELTWEDVTAQADAPHLLTERTSVTNHVRRVATFSNEGIVRATRINRPTELAVTFADYLDWGVHESDILTEPVDDFIDRLEQLTQVQVMLVKTGPRTTVDFEPYRLNMLRRLRW